MITGKKFTIVNQSLASRTLVEATLQ
ncbi:Protein of unknown function [Lactobacillus helveticus CIRM-BIA 103]|nr:Protein of unknown function [Lactobacillus helveticus CIRM-BIA 103]